MLSEKCTAHLLHEGCVLQQQLAVLRFDVSGQGRLARPVREALPPLAIEGEGDDRVTESPGVVWMHQEPVLVVPDAFG